MKLSMHVMAVQTFAPMLESLAACLDKGAEHARDASIDLVNARLAPDMFTLAQQVQQACHYAKDCTARLAGRDTHPMHGAGTTLAELKSQIGTTLAYVHGVPAAELDGAEARNCNIDLPGDMVIEMDGERFLRAWALPHFYFHVVTAYGILRHAGVQIGKQDCLSQVGSFVRPKEK